MRHKNQLMQHRNPVFCRHQISKKEFWVDPLPRKRHKNQLSTENFRMIFYLLFARCRILGLEFLMSHICLFFLSISLDAKAEKNRPFWPTRLLVKTFVHRFIFIPTCISRSEVFLNWKLAGWCVWRQLGCLLWGLCWNNISSFELFHIMRRSEFVYLKLGKKRLYTTIVLRICKRQYAKKSKPLKINFHEIMLFPGKMMLPRDLKNWGNHLFFLSTPAKPFHVPNRRPS